MMATGLETQYDKIQTMAAAFPENTSLILQVYHDLALNKQWKMIQPIALDELETCIMYAREPGGDQLVILPIQYDQELSPNMISRTFHDLDKAMLSIGKDIAPLKKITFGIVARDSTVLYYHIHKGLVPPKEHQ